MDRIDWRKLEMFEGSDDEGQAADYYHCPNGKEWFVRRLLEFRDQGGMDGGFFARIGADHEDPEDASTWGPKDPEDIDWTGFPVAVGGTLCRMVRFSDTGVCQPAGEIEDWDEVKAAADGGLIAPNYLSGLMGWAPYTAHYMVRLGGENLHYFVAEPIYGLSTLAKAIGWAPKKLATYRARRRAGEPLVPRPSLEGPAGPIWTHHAVAGFIVAQRKRAIDEIARYLEQLPGGAWAHGGDPEGTAQEWCNAGFGVAETEEWLSARCFDAASAAALRDAGITAGDARWQPEGNPETIGYLVSNGDMTVERARELIS